MKAQRRQELFNSSLKHSCILSTIYNVNNQFGFTSMLKVYFTVYN